MHNTGKNMLVSRQEAEAWRRPGAHSLCERQGRAQPISLLRNWREQRRVSAAMATMQVAQPPMCSPVAGRGPCARLGLAPKRLSRGQTHVTRVFGGELASPTTMSPQSKCRTESLAPTALVLLPSQGRRTRAPRRP